MEGKESDYSTSLVKKDSLYLVDDNQIVKPKYLVIKVNNEEGEIVDVKLPISIAKYAKKLKFLNNFKLENLNIDEIIKCLDSSTKGKIMFIRSKNKNVEINIE